jgi:hypothetical protein
VKKSELAFLLLIVLFGVQGLVFDGLSIHERLSCEINKFSSESVYSAGQINRITADQKADVLHSVNTFYFLSKEKIDEQHFATVVPFFFRKIIKLVSSLNGGFFLSIFSSTLDCLYPYFFFF